MSPLASSDKPLLELQGVSKSFGATRALDNVNLTVCRGEVHALIGENGAGKSTLMKVLSGAHKADTGNVYIDGALHHIDSPASGMASGIAMIYQELMLAEHLTVEENLMLGREPHKLGFIRSERNRIRDVLALLGHADLPLNAPVAVLSVGIQQVIEIARALLREARIIIMDEPTSSLSAADARILFSVIRKLRERGISFVYISHFLEEVFEVADRFTVLRDGKTVQTGNIADTSVIEIIRLMVGRSLDEMFPKIPHIQSEQFLKVEGLCGDTMPQEVGFSLHRGEILGVAGLVGSGRSEVLRGLFGLHPVRSGVMYVGRKKLALKHMQPRLALDMGIDLLSENRKEEGLSTDLPITHNITLSSLKRFAFWHGFGPLKLRRESSRAAHWTALMNIRCRDACQQVADLSGGNQQKVALARMLEQDAEVLLLDEPTRGVDVGSKVEIYRLIGELAASGKGIIFVSSYLPELLGVSDTLAVMHRGVMSAVRPVEEWNEDSIMQVATSGLTALKDDLIKNDL